MGYQPIYDGSFDIASLDTAKDVFDLITSITGRKMVITDWVTSGPGKIGAVRGECPGVTIRGTRRQLVSWLTEYYDTNYDMIGSVDDGAGGHRAPTNDEVWHAHREMGTFTFVA